jgi:antibiotic biosynthesis monooxygenase (ABM) superfamily enzyme
MAKHSSHILEMARKGADHKYEELKAEIAALIKNFPHLHEGKVSVRKAASVKPHNELASERISTRKSAAWSAAAKRAVSLRMKKYWAEKRAAAKK